MDRKEFLAQMGLTSAAIFMGTCLGGCSKDDGGGGNAPPAPTGVNFTINLSDAANAPLATPGGYIYNSGIIIARTLADQYIAVSQRCTHEGFTVVFEGTNNRFYCPNHGSTFSTTGSVNNGPAGAPLTRYNTALTGSSLRVYS